MSAPAQQSFTAPPEEAGLRPFLSRKKRQAIAAASHLLMPIMKKAAGAYLGGETVDEALLVVRRLKSEGHAVTLGYWDVGRESVEECTDLYRNAISALTGDEYLSLKPPALQFSLSAARLLARQAAEQGIRLHCDSHGPEAADATNAFAEALCEILPPQLVSITLPGRWQRSRADADWAMARGLPVRVVKGQWSAPANSSRDIGEGFLDVIDRLTQNARHVAVATHDFFLAREAIGRLKAAGVSCEIEVLLGLSAKPLLAWARETGIPTRVYVPYGPGFVPNAIGVLRRNPRLLIAVAKERLGAMARIRVVVKNK